MGSSRMLPPGLCISAGFLQFSIIGEVEKEKRRAKNVEAKESKARSRRKSAR